MSEQTNNSNESTTKATDEKRRSTGFIIWKLATLGWFLVFGCILLLFVKIRELTIKMELFKNAFSRLRPISVEIDDEEDDDEQEDGNDD